MNFRELTQTNEQQAVGQGDAVSQIDTAEKLSAAEAPRMSLFALCWLGIAAIAMLGWISALGWLAWRLANWALF
ncbi:RNA-binding protein [Bradyrhizobium sp. INPA01-394B]|uniref:RNA-binding protein n=1 Tax=Bradyrhizobium campsiandrae TaxID=1729892 RepID=A0ABR7U2X2_9BRAD|nr:RNA-binding protein [Bradyrhizobium campsiandrae]MBC9880294.1 RNA-binding protein [Bradyrhizobium campsiandrae]MBC9978395.1 RNA-binding protein [Bradyrhizobium campsiandrae]